jgi:leucyl-tRNA synthetase
LHHQSWPKLDESYLVQTEFELVFQVNGKIRKRKLVPVTISEKEALSLAEVELKEHLEGKTIVKQIYVPRKLCNIVIKG